MLVLNEFSCFTFRVSADELAEKASYGSLAASSLWSESNVGPSAFHPSLSFGPVVSTPLTICCVTDCLQSVLCRFTRIYSFTKETLIYQVSM